MASLNKAKSAFRGWPAVTFMLGFHYCWLFGIFEILLGGGKGPIKEGRCYLEAHGVLTQVPIYIW